MKTQIGALLNKEFNKKHYLQNTKTSRKNSYNPATNSTLDMTDLHWRGLEH